jgi:hypothetical protein
MILEDVVSITDLDGEVMLDEARLPTPPRLLLRNILLQYIQLSDGHQLLTEIHQSGRVMGKVQAVVPNTPEAEQMILMMNKNFPAYVGYVLHDQGLPDGFLMELFQCMCCPPMISKMALCTWDPDSGTLTTARKADEWKNLAELEKVSWYKNAFEDIGTVKRSNPNPPQSCFLTWMKTAPSRLSISVMRLNFL